MKRFLCDDCERPLTKETKNTVRVTNIFNQTVALHFCASCALRKLPELKSMIGWTMRHD